LYLTNYWIYPTEISYAAVETASVTVDSVANSLVEVEGLSYGDFKASTAVPISQCYANMRKNLFRVGGRNNKRR